MLDWLQRLHRIVIRPPSTPDNPRPRHWIERMDEPFFANREEAETYMTRELTAAAPAGWIVSHVNGTLGWQLHPEKRESILHHEYTIHISDSLDYVIFYYGNNDGGPLFQIVHMMPKALVMQASVLRGYDVRACIAHLLKHSSNVHGYS